MLFLIVIPMSGGVRRPEKAKGQAAGAFFL